MFEPVMAGLGEVLRAFHSNMVPSSKSARRFARAGFSDVVQLVPQSERMIDALNELLARPRLSAPVLLAALDTDWIPANAHAVSDTANVTFPLDTKDRQFKVRTMDGEIRAQLAFCASGRRAAEQLAAQFAGHLEAMGLDFHAAHEFAGLWHGLPAMIEIPENPAISVDTGSRTASAVAINLALRVTVPLFMAPQPGEPNDGKGVPGTNDPAGYPVDSVAGDEPEAEGVITWQ